MANQKKSISVIVPVYNGSLTLKNLVERLEITLSENASEFEVLLVNDGSQDDSWQVIKRIALEKNFVKGIDLMRNYGQHNALLMGIRAASNEIAVTIDDDLQNPPEEIPKMLTKLYEGYDVVYGSPKKERHGLLRNAASRFTKFVLRISMGIEIAPKVGAFRVFYTNIREAFSEFNSPFVSIDVLLAWGATNFTSIPVDHEYRQIGKSNYTIKILVTHAFNMITGFSTWPLRMASMIGFMLTVFGIGILAYVLITYFIRGSDVTGFTFLASIISLFAGAQLFALGVIGEYVARMYFRTMEQPVYVIRNTTDQDASVKKN